MGSAWNALVNWEDGSEQYDLLSDDKRDALDMYAQYALDNKLLEKPEWNQFLHRTKDQSPLDQKVNQHKKHHEYYASVFRNSAEIPRIWEDAHSSNKDNGNNMWAVSEQLDIEKLFAYEFAIDRGKLKLSDPTLEGCKRIPCQMIYAIQLEGWHTHTPICAR